ncbi:hypothetical protein C791_6658 [Amycolatopsis azurea DSM 43854]|uniref:Uncharacterized protein n=1 Tax=Amycolatopsis azurea DSM 43854 TaxID=1238180 RepID=M2QAM4_9PSEU|nr:hypothetical protein C791_6658 [Amycolatopsis azurea DSM 43854]
MTRRGTALAGARDRGDGACDQTDDTRDWTDDTRTAGVALSRNKFEIFSNPGHEWFRTSEWVGVHRKDERNHSCSESPLFAP